MSKQRENTKVQHLDILSLCTGNVDGNEVVVLTVRDTDKSWRSRNISILTSQLAARLPELSDLCKDHKFSGEEPSIDDLHRIAQASEPSDHPLCPGINDE